MDRTRVYRAVGATGLHAGCRIKAGPTGRGSTRCSAPGFGPTTNRDSRRWEVARNHFLPLVEALAERFGEVDPVPGVLDQEKMWPPVPRGSWGRLRMLLSRRARWRNVFARIDRGG